MSPELLSRLLPSAIVAAMFLAQFPYWAQGDWRRAVYWLSASVLNFAVTY